MVESWELEGRARTPANSQCNTNTYTRRPHFSMLACIHTDICKLHTCIHTHTHTYVHSRHMCRTLVPVEPTDVEETKPDPKQKPKAKAKSKRQPVLASGAVSKKPKK